MRMPATNLSPRKAAISGAVDRLADRLRRIALDIHAHPETGWDTPRAVAWLTAPLGEAGFALEAPLAGLSSAFRAGWDGGGGAGPTVGILAEYDALRGIGHGCGHNLIGTAAVGAALALKAAVPELAGRIQVIGTPFEEGGGGKIVLAERGVFDLLDAALLCHPQRRTMVARGGLACISLTIRYHGKASHASSAPERGISAQDAVLQLFFGVNQLRQFAPAGHRIHGIITRGGEAPNIVPALAEAEFLVRAVNRRELADLTGRVRAIAAAAAAATGARLEIEEGLTYAERYESRALSRAFAANLETLGEPVEPPTPGIGSSDMGNVGEVCPAAHPYIKICDEATHSPEFAAAAASEGGMRGLLLAAKALAMTALDLCEDPALLSAIADEHAAYRKAATSAAA
jgi:amidohydrolase